MASILLAPDGDPAGGSPPSSTPPASPPAAAPPAAGGEPANPSHKDWNALAANLRAMADGVKAQTEMLGKLTSSPAAPPKPEPAPTGNAAADAALAKVSNMEAHLALREALADAEVKGAQREALTLMWQGAGRPAEGLAEWVAKHRAMLGGNNPASPPLSAPPVVPPIAPSDTGPPVSTHSVDGKPQGHPLTWPMELVGKMKPEEYRAAIREFEDRSGRSSSVKKFFDARQQAQDARRKQH
mgnify:FL=1